VLTRVAALRGDPAAAKVLASERDTKAGPTAHIAGRLGLLKEDQMHSLSLPIADLIFHAV
jgi:hypothetical protein